ncbi:MAG TPA: rhodanese-like domain-containing protein [Kofleriaceae bacterium]
MPEFESVSATEAIDLAKGESWLVDVREPDEWEVGHAEGAYSLPMSQLNERIAELPLDTTLLVICHSGGRSAKVTEALVGQGYNAINVAGGTLGWQSAGGVVVADGPAPRP